MELSVLERVVLMGILPQESNYITHKIVTNLKMELSFSEQEIKDYKIVEKDGKIYWDDKFEKPKNVEIGDKAKEIIAEELKKLDEQKKINDLNASLYERFVLTVK